MLAIVTGGAGFIGAALAQALLDRGDEVIVIDDLSSGKIERIPEGAHFVEGDVRDGSRMTRTCRGARVIFHQAALRSVPRSMDEPMVVHDVNASGTLALLEAARAAKVPRFVYASSSSVYGGAGDGPSSEEMPPKPLSPYAVSKLTGEYYCRVYAQLGWVHSLSLRYFNVFGPGQPADSRYAAVFPAFISALRRGEAPSIHWDGEQSRDFTYIDDIVEANLRAADSDVPAGAVVNAAGGRPRTINEVFASIDSIIGSGLEPRREAKRPGDIRHSYADTSKAMQLIGWGPTTGWDEAVARTVEWFDREVRTG